MSTFPPPPGEGPTSPPPWPTAPGADRPPDDGRHRRGVPQGLVLALAALLGAAVVVAGLVAWDREDGAGDDTTAAPTTVPGATAPPPSEPPGTDPPAPQPPGTAEPPVDEVVPLACPAEVPAPVCEAADYVQRETGRAFRQFPDVELADDDEFRARLRDVTEEELPEVEAFGRTLSAIGLVDPDIDLVDALRDLYALGVVGFYEPEADVLVVRGTDTTPYTRITLVHELVHALDDQWFDVDRPEYDDADGEEAFGFAALAEGHASVIDARYRASLSPADQQAAAGEELRLLLESGTDLMELPRVLVEMLGAPYLLGAPLVEEILAAGGQQALAQAYSRPPTTSEQVMHPELYLAGEPAVEVPTPPAGGEVVEEAVMGEYGMGLWLAGDEAAAAGWGGDRYVTWADGDRWCTRMDLVLDTPVDLAEARDAFGRWAAGAPRRTVEDTAVGASPALRVTGCS